MKVGFFGGKFLPWHKGHISVAVKASYMVDKLYVIAVVDKEKDNLIPLKNKLKRITLSERLSWIGESLQDFPSITVFGVTQDSWEDGANKIKKGISEPITHVFSSEPSYSEFFHKAYPQAEHIIIDADRKDVPISGTEIRKDPYKHWEVLSKGAKRFFTKKVCITGTESCGKSTLTQRLAAYYNTNYVHEIGRDYCDIYKGCLTLNHYKEIAMKHHLLQIEKSAYSNKILFIDSDAVITKYYLDLYENSNDDNEYIQLDILESLIKEQQFDLYLYLEPDVPWVDDGFRKHGDPEVRQDNDDILHRLYDFYSQKHIQNTYDGDCLSGSYYEKFNRAIELINGLF